MRAAWLVLVAACGYPEPAQLSDAALDAFVEPIDAAGTMTVSCVGLAKTCGSAGTDTCCTSPRVTGGSYFRSFDMAADMAFNDMTHAAKISDFRLDKYEVTVGRFRAFVTANGGTQAHPPMTGTGAHATIPGSGWDVAFNPMLKTSTAALTAALKCDSTFATWTDTAGPNETRPINCVTWFEAQAFCTYDGGYLATEAEWNYAAAGGSMQRAFPWSSPATSTTIDGSFASFSTSTGNCTGDNMAGCALTDLIDVGTKPAGDGAFGQSDLGGNVAEWTLDAYAANYLTTTCDDCADLTLTVSGRAERGGSFLDASSVLRSAARANTDPTSRNALTGIRCARPL